MGKGMGHDWKKELSWFPWRFENVEESELVDACDVTAKDRKEEEEEEDEDEEDNDDDVAPLV